MLVVNLKFVHCICFFKDNLFEWHFTIRGPEDSEFEGGIYHGRIILPPDYPMKPPSIILLTVSTGLFLHCQNSGISNFKFCLCMYMTFSNSINYYYYLFYERRHKIFCVLS